MAGPRADDLPLADRDRPSDMDGAETRFRKWER